MRAGLRAGWRAGLRGSCSYSQLLQHSKEAVASEAAWNPLQACHPVKDQRSKVKGHQQHASISINELYSLVGPSKVQVTFIL